MKKRGYVSAVSEVLPDLLVDVLVFLRNAVLLVVTLLEFGGLYAIAAYCLEGCYLPPFSVKLALFAAYSGIVMLAFLALVAVLAVTYFLSIFMAEVCRKTAMKMYPKYRRNWIRAEKFFRNVARFIVFLKDIALCLVMLLDFE